MAEKPFAFGEKWYSKCFICDTRYEDYTTENRLCKVCVDRYRETKFFRGMSDLASCFATIIPEPKSIPEDLLRQGYEDLLLRMGEKNAATEQIFKEIFAHRLHLPCGQPVLFTIEHLAQFAGFAKVWTLDLSPYIWSGTLKDLRSWAVLSLAIEHGIQHLALWTAGNAGFSLAKLVHRWNATASAKDRKVVYCLMDAFAPPEVVVTLRSLQCRVAPISTGAGAILTREQLYHVFASLAGEQENYWQVTDGWDGVGIFMYSLLAQQSLYFLREELKKIPELESANIYIVLPLGTGNLLLGFIKGKERTKDSKAKVVAAVPFGDHMMMPFLPPEDEKNGGLRMRRVEPEAPKLTGFYSPLSPCLWHLAQNRNFADPNAVDFIEVDRASQIEAAARVLGSIDQPTIASEPSALIAFGAIKQLAQRIRNYGQDPKKSVVLVVNSGFGLMGVEEQEFFTKSIFAFR